ncbi:MAG: peptidase M14 [Polaromonas sp.]|nr:peptidase M14 [Polaromonas sp.]
MITVPLPELPGLDGIRRSRRLIWVLMATLLALLSACTSTPLPVWTAAQDATSAEPPSVFAPSVSKPSIARQAPPAPPAQAINDQSGQSGQNQPAKALALVSAPAPAAPAPYSAAVADRFPAPSVIYNTPGLQDGRSAFSTQTEIQTWLRDQAAMASRTAGVTAAVLPIGQSQRGIALEALILTRASGTSPALLQNAGKPTVLLIGQQHGNEPAGSEALLVIARELAQGLLQPLLQQINVVIVPRGNPDGGASDLRATNSGLDMNRDHLLLNTPEAQALARLARDYRPMVVVDAHEYTVVGRFLEKFGSVQKFDVLLQYATTANLPEFLTKASEEWYRRPIVTALKNAGLSNEWYYTTSTDPLDKKISMGGALPDTGRNVYGLKNAVSLLIETRGVGIGRLHIQRRVHTHVTAISSVLASTAQRASELAQLRPYLDKEVSAMACKDEAVVEAVATPAQYDLMMLDPVTGADKAVAVDWDSALALRKVKVRARPCGYLLSAASGTAIERLAMHGVQVLRVAESGSMLGDSYSQTSLATGERLDVRGTIADGDPIIRAEVRLMRGVVDVSAGSYYVPLNQPLGNLVIAALEPDTQSSYFANRILADLSGTVRIVAPPNIKLEELP